MTISEILEEVKNDICKDYCKYVEGWEGNCPEDEEQFFECLCNECPLNRL